MRKGRKRKEEEEGREKEGGRDGQAYSLIFKGYLEDKNLEIYAA